MAKPKSSPIRIPSAKSGDQPATRKMLSLVRDELKSDIRGLDRRMLGMEQKIEGRFHQVEARMESGFSLMEFKFSQMESKLSQMESKFSGMGSELSRMQFLLEEQNANNRIVLEGLQALWTRQDRIEGLR